MKVLVFGQNAIGDHISNVLSIGRALYEAGHEVDGVFYNIHGYQLLRETPYFNACVLLNDRSKDVFRDIAKWFSEYDKVYISSDKDDDLFWMWVESHLLENVVAHKLVEPITPVERFRPILKLEELWLEYQPGYINLQINWYQDYYENFQCGANSVLLSHTSKELHKSYSHVNDLRDLLTEAGFDVRFVDITKDVRTNMHLVHQVAHVLTVDTFILWAAKSIGKEPYIFIDQGENGRRRVYESRLGARNIVPWYDKMDDIPPEVIAEGFINAIKERKIAIL